MTKKFLETGSVLEKKSERKNRISSAEKLNKIGARLEVSPRKLSRLATHLCFVRKLINPTTFLEVMRPIFAPRDIISKYNQQIL